MPAQAQRLVRQLETFLHNRDAIFSDENMRRVVPRMENNTSNMGSDISPVESGN